ncbi:MAG: hypothetical protein F4Z55_14765 [Boseongicola sp. SB0667_bin_21]|nr:hypothetical protein [Boseongicola sp. SB0667_bin_21]
MQRITNPDDLFFPVDTRPIFTRTGGLRPDRGIPAPGKMVIVNSAKDEVLGIEGRNYRLVTNRDAFACARACARAAFPETTEDEWVFLAAADATQSGSYCHIDLSHRTGQLDFN